MMMKRIICIMALSFTPQLSQGFASYFKKCVRGYHLLNAEPIKESVWEAINTQVLTHSGCTVHSQSSGSHSPGSDISSSAGNFSNKSVKYEASSHDHFNISSYRLTSVCSASTPGNITEVVAEINRRKNFQYYSIIARDEQPDKILYDWFILPADHPLMNPSLYTWKPLIGKRGKNKDIQIGWQTETINGSSMSITFSMSSQLWISISITEEMKQNYIVASTEVKKQTIMDYVQLAENYPEDTL
jgi:hypothetical protein